MEQAHIDGLLEWAKLATGLEEAESLEDFADGASLLTLAEQAMGDEEDSDEEDDERDDVDRLLSTLCRLRGPDAVAELDAEAIRSGKIEALAMVTKFVFMACAEGPEKVQEEYVQKLVNGEDGLSDEAKRGLMGALCDLAGDEDDDDESSDEEGGGLNDTAASDLGASAVGATPARRSACTPGSQMSRASRSRLSELLSAGRQPRLRSPAGPAAAASSGRASLEGRRCSGGGGLEALRAQLESAEEVDALQGQLDQERQKVSELTARVARLEREADAAAELREEVEQLQEEAAGRARAEAALARLRTKLQRAKEAQEQLETLTTEHEGLLKRAHEAEGTAARVPQLEAEVAQYRHAHQTADLKAQTAEAELSDTREQLQEAKEAAKAARAAAAAQEAAARRGAGGEAEAGAEAASSVAGSVTMYNPRVAALLAELREENERLKSLCSSSSVEALQSKDRAIEDLRVKAEVVGEQLATALRRERALNGRLEDTTEAKEALEQQVAALQVELSAEQVRSGKLVAEVAGLSDERDQLNSRLGDCQQQLQHTTELLEAEREANATKAAGLATEAARAAAAESALAATGAELDARQSELAERDTELAASQKANHALKAKCKRLGRDLEAHKESLDASADQIRQLRRQVREKEAEASRARARGGGGRDMTEELQQLQEQLQAARRKTKSEARRHQQQAKALMRVAMAHGATPEELRDGLPSGGLAALGGNASVAGGAVAVEAAAMAGPLRVAVSTAGADGLASAFGEGATEGMRQLQRRNEQLEEEKAQSTTARCELQKQLAAVGKDVDALKDQLQRSDDAVRQYQLLSHRVFATLQKNGFDMQLLQEHREQMEMWGKRRRPVEAAGGSGTAREALAASTVGRPRTRASARAAANKAAPLAAASQPFENDDEEEDEFRSAADAFGSSAPRAAPAPSTMRSGVPKASAGTRRPSLYAKNRFARRTTRRRPGAAAGPSGV